MCASRKKREEFLTEVEEVCKEGVDRWRPLKYEQTSDRAYFQLQQDIRKIALKHFQQVPTKNPALQAMR